MIVVFRLLIEKGKGEEPKVPHHASAAATRDDYVTTACLIPDTGNSSFMVAIYIYL
jgi:hypothetical protein